MEGNFLTSDNLTDLAVRMKKGDRRAAARLYDELLPKVFGFLFARTGKKEVAEDLCQDIFVKLVEKVKTFDQDRGRFTVWFWQITRNALIDYYREKKESPFSNFEEDTVAAMATTEMPNIEERLRYDKMKIFLRTLEKEERELFELRYIVQMPYKEIAVVLAKSEGSLRVAALRIKEKVRHGLGSVA